MPWLSTPQFKLQISGETYINDQNFSLQNCRPENNVSYLVLSVNDYKSEKYIDVFDAFDAIDLSLRYGTDSWIKVFSGYVSTATPRLSIEGEVLDVTAWGKEYGISKTHCSQSYGAESDRPTKDTPQEILVDLVTWFINRSFGSATTTGHNLSTSKIENIHSGLSITHLPGNYIDNFTMINRLCDVVNAYAQGLGTPEVGIHWFVSPDANVYVKKIDSNHSDGNWSRYWRGSQAASTLVVKEDMILYQFRKNVEEYANRIVLCLGFRKPTLDFWTENQSGLWGTENATLINSTTRVVGSYSLLIQNTGASDVKAYYPSTEDAGWDITKCGSNTTIPHLSFYFRKNSNITIANVLLFSTDHNANYFYIQNIFGLGSSGNDVFEHYSLPIGPYYDTVEENRQFKWGSTGSPTWSNINGICFFSNGHPTTTTQMYIDDLHFSGKIIREALDTSELSTNREYQRVIINDVAVDDSLNATNDSYLAARLAYAELLRRAQIPIVGMIQIPMAVDMLPGQTVHIHACQKSDGTYRIDKDFRIKELKHVILPTQQHGFRTVLNLTDDVTNTHAFGVPTMQSLLSEYVGGLGHAEARDLKASGIDTKIARLAKAYA